jgi:transcriptional regulator of acetoin/glycerol metabolism
LKPEHFPNLLNKDAGNIVKVRSTIKKKSHINSELIDIFDEDGRCKTIDAIEEEIIKRLLEINNGNLSEVAKQLNIGRSTIYRKLKILNSN